MPACLINTLTSIHFASTIRESDCRQPRQWSQFSMLLPYLGLIGSNRCLLLHLVDLSHYLKSINGQPRNGRVIEISRRSETLYQQCYLNKVGKIKKKLAPIPQWIAYSNLNFYSSYRNSTVISLHAPHPFLSASSGRALPGRSCPDNLEIIKIN